MVSRDTKPTPGVWASCTCSTAGSTKPGAEASVSTGGGVMLEGVEREGGESPETAGRARLPGLCASKCATSSGARGTRDGCKDTGVVESGTLAGVGVP